MKLVFLIFSAGLICSGVSGNDEKFQQFLAMVSDNISAALDYEIPTDNSKLVQVGDLITHLYGVYDFIIIGAGSAGAVIANRLTEIEGWSVLLLEAGGEDNEFSDIPALVGYNFFSDMNWGYNTTPQTNSCLGMKNRQCFFPRGKVLGGSSTINAAMYVRGNRLDFDRWEELGNTGWSYDSVLPYFKKSEKASLTGQDWSYHGHDGYLHVEHATDSPLRPLYNKAFQELGQEEIDYNGKNQFGFGKFQFTCKHNKRDSTSRAFLDNIKDRKNLKISLRSHVTKILVSKLLKTAVGVKFIKGGKEYIALSNKDVIVSAGSINTPQILILSGIGPKAHLKELGIEVIKDLPVGENLQDHLMYLFTAFRFNRTIYNVSFEETLKLYLKNLRPLTASFGGELVSFINFENSSKIQPEVEFLVISPLTFNNQAGRFFGLNDENTEAIQIGPYDQFVVIPSLLHPKSVGTVRLRSKDPKDMPIIDPKYLSDTDGYDRKTIYKAIQFILKLNRTKAFRDFKAVFDHPPVPTCDRLYSRFSKDWWFCSIRTLATTIYHPIGTTRMGNSAKDSVVDNNLKVHGIRRLRVVDGGVFPSHTSGHTNAPIIMVAEKTSDIIKQCISWHHTYGKLNETFGG